MATGNFKSMDKFPLIATGDKYCKICPECGCTMDAHADTCDECEHDLQAVKAVYDEFAMEYTCREMEAVAERLTEGQDFFKVTVESGYYGGIQFYVDEKFYEVENWTNEDAQDEFGICRSECLRRYKVAENFVRKGLEKASKEMGLDKLAITARFSNGETWYSKEA